MNEYMSSESAEPQWRPLKRARAYEQVIDAIEEQISVGALRVGDALPPERELAAQLGVSRAAVREAVRVLESLGALRSKQGAGAEAGTFIAALTNQAMTRFLRLHVALANFSVSDILDSRVMLERESVTRAARLRGEGALDQMAAALAVMEDPESTRADFNQADTDFHLAIAHASGSELSATLTAAIRESMTGPILQAMLRSQRWDEIAPQLCREHREIQRAIAAGDGAGAADLVEAHIRQAAVVLPTALSPELDSR